MSVPRSFALPLPLHRGYRSLMNCRRSPCPHKLPHPVGQLAVSWISACLTALGGASIAVLLLFPSLPPAPPAIPSCRPPRQLLTRRRPDLLDRHPFLSRPRLSVSLVLVFCRLIQTK